MIFHSTKTSFNYIFQLRTWSFCLFFLRGRNFALCTRVERQFCFRLNFSSWFPLNRILHLSFIFLSLHFRTENFSRFTSLILLSFNWFYLRVYCLIIPLKFDSRYETPLNSSAIVPENFFFSARTILKSGDRSSPLEALLPLRFFATYKTRNFLLHFSQKIKRKDFL